MAGRTGKRAKGTQVTGEDGVGGVVGIGGTDTQTQTHTDTHTHTHTHTHRVQVARRGGNRAIRSQGVTNGIKRTGI